MKPIVDIIEDFIGTISLSGLILSATTDGTNTTLTLENPYHARAEMLINVDGTDYPILSVSDRDIVVSGVLNAPQAYTISTPVYYHGTPLLTNAHITQARPSQKYPMIYLYEVIKEKDNNEDNRIRKEAELRFFFLDTADFGEWSTDDHYSKRLIGLNRLVEEFIKELKKSKCFYTFETVFTRSNHPNWGVYRSEKGHVSRIFDDDLTGVELAFLLQVRECCLSEEAPPEDPKTIIEGFEYPAGTEFIEFEVAPPRISNSSDRSDVGFSIKAIDGLDGQNAFDIIYNSARQNVIGSASYPFLEPCARTDNEELSKVYIVSLKGWDKLEELVTIVGSNRLYAYNSNITDYVSQMINLKNVFWYSMYGIDWWEFLTCEKLEVFNLLQSTNGKNIKKPLPASLTQFRTQGATCAPYVIDNANFGHLVNLTDFAVFFGDSTAIYKSGAQNWLNIATVDFRNQFMPAHAVNNFIIDLDAGGVENGFLNYINNEAPTSASFAAYNNLIARGWTIIGTPPPAP